MLLIPIDPASPVPLWRQVRDRVVSLVDDGALRPGDRLPPTRALARTLGLGRTTLVRAYEELRALGYLESRSGSYSTVRRRARPAPSGAGPGAGGELREAPRLRWGRLIRRAARSARADVPDGATGTPPPDGVIDFSRLSLDPALSPHAELRRCLGWVLARGKGAALDYGDPAGARELREAISRRMRAHGVGVTAGEIVVTAGAQGGLDAILTLLAAPGDRVVVEAPTYGMAHVLLRTRGLVPVEVPVREEGLDLDALERALGRGRRPRLLYTMPSFHNPTGVTTGQAHRERLLSLCEARGVPVVEDGFEEEMKYFGQAVLPVKSMDARGIVLYLGTFSKVAFPGLRLGWIVAPREAAEHLSALEAATRLGGSPLVQAAVARFCGQGLFEAHLRRVHRAFRRRMQAMLRGLDENVPTGVAWSRPSGGYTVWMRLPGPPQSEPGTCARLLSAGVKVAPGRAFFGAPPRAPHARLSISGLDEHAIAEGCRRIGLALRDVLGDGQSPAPAGAVSGG